MSDAFQRWQDKTNEHLGSVTNTVLSLASAGIAFLVANLDKHTGYLGGTVVFAFWGALGLFGLSIEMALLGMASRLADFRATMRIARARTRGPSSEPTALAELRDEAEGAGKRTWRYFYVQLGSFAVGMGFLAFYFLAAYSAQLLQPAAPAR